MHWNIISSIKFLLCFSFIILCLVNFKALHISSILSLALSLFQYSLVSFSEFGYTLEEVSLDLHTDNMPEITTEYEDKFSKDGMPIYYVMCNKDVNK